jgi:hypothetical protein
LLKVFSTGLLLLVSSANISAQTADTVIIRAKYHLEINNLSFLSSVFVWFGRRIGVVPDTLEYYETSVCRAGKEISFGMDLRDLSGKEWLRAFSNLSQFSFINPPRFPLQNLKEDTLRSDVIFFVAGIRNFFRTDSANFFRAKFALWKDTVSFSVMRDSTRPLLYRLSSVNARGKPYLRGSVLIGRLGDRIIYPWLRLELLEAGATVILEMTGMKIG